MAVTVKMATATRPFEWHTDKDGSHALMFSNTLVLRIEKDGREYDCCVNFHGRDDIPGSPCFRCDGLSVPRIFRWFLPDWSGDNDLYNLAGAVHDWLYATVGAYKKFTRSECDDIFRGILRESGLGRFRASTADYMVGLFAGNSRHWGNDDMEIRDMAVMKFF
jgi:hypothetical protein